MHPNLYAILVTFSLCISGCAFTPERPLDVDLSYSVRALDPAQISVLSWNIQKGNADGWPEALENGQVESRIADFDLILLQEACLDQAQDLQDFGPKLRRRGYGWHFASSFVSSVWGCRDGATTGVVIASRVPPVQALAIRSTDSEFFITPKASLAMLFPIEGRAELLLVINTHLLNFELINNNDYKNQLLDLFDLIDQHQGPVILAGDLNTRNQTRMDAITAAMLEACLSTVLPTPPDLRTTDKLHDNFVLDHVLFRDLQAMAPLHVGAENIEEITDHNSIAALLSFVPDTECGL